MLHLIVRDFMTSSVVTLREDDSVHKASVTLAVNGISGAPVVDESEHLLGVLSSVDILRYIREFKPEMSVDCPTLLLLATPEDENLVDPGLSEAHRRISETRVRDIMTQEVVTCDPDDRLMTALNLMLENDVRRLPVVERGRVVGIISRKDIIWAIYRGRT